MLSAGGFQFFSGLHASLLFFLVFLVCCLIKSITIFIFCFRPEVKEGFFWEYYWAHYIQTFFLWALFNRTMFYIPDSGMFSGIFLTGLLIYSSLIIFRAPIIISIMIVSKCQIFAISIFLMFWKFVKLFCWDDLSDGMYICMRWKLCWF